MFIAAKNLYYAFDICPGFWNGILQAHEKGSVRSIDRIRNELLSGRKEEDLVLWVKRGRDEQTRVTKRFRGSVH